METTPPKRHGCLTVFLVFMLIANAFTMAIYLLSGDKITAKFPNVPSWLIYTLGVGCLFNIVFIISIFRWKKWAFYACCVVAVIVFFVNVAIGLPVFNAVLGLAGPVVLYGLFQMGGENKGWKHLK
jgi:hypothetical protein